MAPRLFLMVLESDVQAATAAATAGGEEVWGSCPFCFLPVNQTLLAVSSCPARGPPPGGWSSRGGRRETYFPISACDSEGRKVELAHFTEEEIEVQRNHTAHQQ